MDPLSALSLAGTIIQFVDFGSKLLSKAGKLYRSSQGPLKANDELELVSSDLRELVNKLEQSSRSRPSEGQQDPGQEFRQICSETKLVAEELLRRLETLKLDSESKHPKWRSLQMAVKSLWNEKEIESLMQRLMTLKEALETRVLFSIR